ncbi:tetratricopeptide repeat protein [Paraburkholderia sp.]|uniref:tetratricopeptide repeat protein n=1 Tax=Paraburkholderia sp. TaxID=1926495 RepID=UPI002397F2E8|nr:tetratricopeptide repeat protein [Paraburkholderia sp.]MDE1182346.1 tetratricopeptide repeat protein [Paraburkholderia sp.]
MRSLLGWAWLTFHVSANAALMQPIDIRDEVVRYQRNPDAVKVFGTNAINDPVLDADIRYALYFATGRADYAAGRYGQSVLDYDRALFIKANPAAFNNRGLSYRHLDQMDAATQDFLAALKLDPQDSQAWTNLGYVHSLQKRFAQAAADYTHAIEAGHAGADILVARADANAKAGNPTQALADYNQAIALAPGATLARINRGILFFNARRYDDAIADFSFVLTQSPGNPDAALSRAHALMKQQRFDDAIDDYTRVILARPNFADGFEGRAEAYLQSGKATLALPDFTRAIQLAPTIDYFHYWRGTAYDSLKRYDEAIADFNEEIRLSPGKSSAYLARASSMSASGDTEAAIASLTDALRAMPGNTDIYLARALLLEQHHAKAAAIDDYRAILKSEPNNQRAIVYMADDLADLGHVDAARDGYDRASKIDPDNGPLLFGRAQLRFYLHDFAGADADLTRWQNLVRAGKVHPVGHHDYYAAIWRQVIALRSNAAGSPDTLRQDRDPADTLDPAQWPYPVLDFLRGKSSLAALTSAVQTGTADQRTTQICEADSYVGEWYLAHGERADAQQRFAAAVGECPDTFIESVLAKSELTRLAPSASGQASSGTTQPR